MLVRQVYHCLAEIASHLRSGRLCFCPLQILLPDLCERHDTMPIDSSASDGDNNMGTEV
jgi:hypothetical protein